MEYIGECVGANIVTLTGLSLSKYRYFWLTIGTVENYKFESANSIFFPKIALPIYTTMAVSLAKSESAYVASGWVQYTDDTSIKIGVVNAPGFAIRLYGIT